MTWLSAFVSPANTQDKIPRQLTYFCTSCACGGFPESAMRTFSRLTLSGSCESCGRKMGQRVIESVKAQLEAQRRVTEDQARVLWVSYYSMFDEHHVSEMSGAAFEKFLAKLYSRLGYRVSLTAGGADQGVDLILSKNDRRVAVQAKRWTGPVGNAAVQQVIAGKLFYGCSSGIIITTSRFSKSAVALAAKDPTISLVDGQVLSVVCRHFRAATAPEFSWDEWKKIEHVALRFAA